MGWLGRDILRPIQKAEIQGIVGTCLWHVRSANGHGYAGCDISRPIHTAEIQLVCRDVPSARNGCKSPLINHFID